MSNERLLKRITKWSRRQSDHIDMTTYIQTVLDDLSSLYNTRRGSVLINEQYGLPDYTNLFNNLSPPELEMMERSIKETTTLFEPRIKMLSALYQPRKNELGVVRVNLMGQLSYLDTQIPISYDLLLNGDGSVTIETRD